MANRRRYVCEPLYLGTRPVPPPSQCRPLRPLVASRSVSAAEDSVFAHAVSGHNHTCSQCAPIHTGSSPLGAKWRTRPGERRKRPSGCSDTRAYIDIAANTSDARSAAGAASSAAPTALISSLLSDSGATTTAPSPCIVASRARLRFGDAQDTRFRSSTGRSTRPSEDSEVASSHDVDATPAMTFHDGVRPGAMELYWNKFRNSSPG